MELFGDGDWSKLRNYHLRVKIKAITIRKIEVKIESVHSLQCTTNRKDANSPRCQGSRDPYLGPRFVANTARLGRQGVTVTDPHGHDFIP